MTNDTFKILGYSDAEAQIYLLLRKHGTCTGGEIAKYAACPRPTAYKHLETLVSGGLATKSNRNGIMIFTAEPPEKMRNLYNQKLSRLAAQKQTVENTITDLLATPGIKALKPKMTYYEGKNEVETALEDLFLFPDITLLSFWSAKSAINAVSDDFFWHFNKERIKKNIHIQGIWPQNRKIDLRRHPYQGAHPLLKRSIRIAPEGFDTLMNCRIYANKVLCFSSHIENFCFLIESNEYAAMLSNMHKIIWSLSTSYQSETAEIQSFIDDI